MPRLLLYLHIMLTTFLLIIALVLLLSIWLNNLSLRIGVPALLAFLLLGLFLGNSGVIPIEVDNFDLVQNVCTTALIFIMFYGGFGTRWSAVKGVVVEAGLLASFGVVLTAVGTGLLCHYVLKWPWEQSMVLGAVVSSTDAASVFSILRSKRLGLKNNTAPMLEVESGSNDPMANILTLGMLSFFKGTASAGNLAVMLFMQIGIGVLAGFGIAYLATKALQKVNMRGSGYSCLFISAVAIAAYALPDLFGGNGYLSVYIVGMILGNEDFKEKKPIVNFFDGINELMQVLTFFLIGALVDPKELPNDIVPALMVFAFLLIAVRPAAIFSILTPFRKYSFRQMAFISFVGLRGASAIVFAIMCVSGVGNNPVSRHLFNIVFILVLISIALQGSLLPLMAKWLNMIDRHNNVLKTFTDYSEDSSMQFSLIEIPEDSTMANRKVKDLHLPKDVLIALILRGKEEIIARGDTIILPGDKAIIVTRAYQGTEAIFLEKTVKHGSRRVGKRIADVPGSGIIILVHRGKETIIPNGNTILHEGDHLVLLR